MMWCHDTMRVLVERAIFARRQAIADNVRRNEDLIRSLISEPKQPTETEAFMAEWRKEIMA